MAIALETTKIAVLTLFRAWPLGKHATIHIKTEVEYPAEEDEDSNLLTIDPGGNVRGDESDLI